VITTVDLTDPDAWPCPEGCGGLTEDPYGGPCKTCWDKVPSASDLERWPSDLGWS
jgi:hypothetical protein